MRAKFAPLPLIRAFRLSPLLARSNLLDSAFKTRQIAVKYYEKSSYLTRSLLRRDPKARTESPDREPLKNTVVKIALRGLSQESD